jgi:DMSO reductase anchor subunit
MPPDTDAPEIKVSATENKIRKEWSLLVFSLLVIFSSAAAISSYFADRHAAATSAHPADSHIMHGISALGALLAMAVSLFHLGVKKNARRALLNILSSPLSREIAAVIVLALAAATDFFMPGLLPAFVAPSAALVALLTVDLVYLSADRSGVMMLHSGQALFSGLFAASWLTGSVNVFIIFTMLAAGSVVMRIGSAAKSIAVSNLFYLRAVALPAVLILMYLGRDWATVAATALFVAGLIADRALYYDDFTPENIKDKISDHFYNNYEKTRD